MFPCHMREAVVYLGGYKKREIYIQRERETHTHTHTQKKSFTKVSTMPEVWGTQ